MKTLIVGMTLLELIVAISIFAVLSTITYSSLNNVLPASKSINKTNENISEMQMAFHLIQSDLLQKVRRPIRNEHNEYSPAFNTEEVLFEFTRTGYSNWLNEQRSKMARVRYRFKDEKLYREVWSILDRNSPIEPSQSVILSGIKDISIRYFFDKDWQDEWQSNSPNSKEMPLAVELVIDLKSIGSIKRVFMLNSSARMTRTISS